jgi:hypothetical protein
VLAVERRFLCFVSFSPFGKRNEVPHGQWLTVLKKSAKTERAKTQKAGKPQKQENGPPMPTK